MFPALVASILAMPNPGEAPPELIRRDWAALDNAINQKVPKDAGGRADIVLQSDRNGGDVLRLKVRGAGVRLKLSF